MIKSNYTIFGRDYIQPNTFIGGVSATINTASALATKLGISVTRIQAFRVDGANIECAITGGTYQIPASCFYASTAITYYRDNAGLVNTIQYGSFNNCTNFTEGVFPECTTITSGGSTSAQPFYQCSAMTSLIIPKFSSVGGGLSYGHFQGCTSLISLSIPLYSGVIKQKMFQGMSSLNTLIIGNISGIETGGLANCVNLTTFDCSHLTSIGISAFYGCTLLSNINNFNSVLSVSAQAFYSCSALSSVSMPVCTSLNYQVFMGCTGVTSYNFPKLTTINGGGALNQCFQNNTSCNSIYMPKLTTLSDSTAAQGVFNNIKLNCTITVAASLQTANAGAPDGDLQYAIASRGATVIYVP